MLRQKIGADQSRPPAPSLRQLRAEFPRRQEDRLRRHLHDGRRYDQPRHARSQDHLARQAGSLLLSFEGSICLWEGEELGQTDTHLDFEELTDPQGINFWPEPVGRDNTRTPMVWDDSANAGFTTGKPWLPVKAPQLARNVASQKADPGSVLHHYRRVMAFRRQTPALVTGKGRFHAVPPPLLAFTRGGDAGAILCVFNLGKEPQSLTLSGAPLLVGPSDAQLAGRRLELPGNGWAWVSGVTAL